MTNMPNENFPHNPELAHVPVDEPEVTNDHIERLRLDTEALLAASIVERNRVIELLGHAFKSGSGKLN